MRMMIVFIGLGEQWDRFSPNVAQICLKLEIVINHYKSSHLSKRNAKEFFILVFVFLPPPTKTQATSQFQNKKHKFENDRDV